MPAFAHQPELIRLEMVGELPRAMAAELDVVQIYEQHFDFVWRSLRRLGVAPTDLEDAAQDVFVVVHRRLSDVTKPESLRAWMLSIVIRVVRDHRRSLRRKDPGQRLGTPNVDLDQLPDPRGNNPCAAAEQADSVRLLYQMLGELDDAKREVFVLAELEEMTEIEISEALGENVNTVHSRLRAARKAFDQAVERQRNRDEWRL